MAALDYDPTDLVGQDTVIGERKDRATRERMDEVGDFKWLMGQKRGRRVIRRLLEFTGVFRSSMTGNSQTFFNEGQRNVGLKLMSIINAECLDDYVLMIQEHQDNVRNLDDRQHNSQ